MLLLSGDNKLVCHYCGRTCLEQAQDTHAVEKVKGTFRTDLEVRLPVAPVHFSEKSGRIGTKSGMILGRVSLGLGGAITVALDTAEPLCSECGTYGAFISGMPVRLRKVNQ